MAQRYDIFISYRRKGGINEARNVDIKLREMGYNVSFDIDTLGKGKFTDTLRTRLKDCKDFIVIFEQTYYERFYEGGANALDEKGAVKPDAKLLSGDALNEDWCYLELKNALALGKNIIPIIKRDFRFPNNLPKEIKDIAEMNAIELTEKEFKEIFENKLPKYLISKPKFIHHHKKSIVAFLSLIILGIIAFFVNYSMEQKKEAAAAAERAAAQAERTAFIADSLKQRAEFVADSMEKANKAGMQNVLDSINAARTATRATSAPQQGSASDGKRNIFWAGESNEISDILLKKLSGAGVKTGKCSGNGIKISIPKHRCQPAPMSMVRCSYTPQLTIATCENASIDNLNLGKTFNGSDRNESMANKKLYEELQKADFSSWVTKLKALR